MKKMKSSRIQWIPLTFLLISVTSVAPQEAPNNEPVKPESRQTFVLPAGSVPITSDDTYEEIEDPSDDPFHKFNSISELESLGFFEEPIEKDELVTQECPVVNLRPPKDCVGSKPTCWSLGLPDIDCEGRGEFCCFDGCSNSCIDDICLPTNQTTNETHEVEQCYDTQVENCRNTTKQECAPECFVHIEITIVYKPEERCASSVVPECTNVTRQECNDVNAETVHMVEECVNKTKEECTPSTTSECNTKLQEECTDVPTETPTIQPSCNNETVVNCEPVITVVCANNTVPIMKPVQNCVNVTTEQCSEPSTVCHSVPHDNCKLEKVPSQEERKVKKCRIKYFRVCETQLQDSCRGSKFNSYIPYQCHKKPVEVCKLVPRKFCRYELEVYTAYMEVEVCKEQIVEECEEIAPNCTDVTTSECDMSYVTVESIQETCTNVSMKNCRVEHVLDCVNETVIIYGNREECVEKPVEICVDVTSSNCVDVTYPDCVYKNVTQTEIQQECQDITDETCVESLEETCTVIDVPTEVETPNEICSDKCEEIPVTNCTMVPFTNCTTIEVQVPVTQLVYDCADKS